MWLVAEKGRRERAAEMVLYMMANKDACAEARAGVPAAPDVTAMAERCESDAGGFASVTADVCNGGQRASSLRGVPADEEARRRAGDSCGGMRQHERVFKSPQAPFLTYLSMHTPFHPLTDYLSSTHRWHSVTHSHLIHASSMDTSCCLSDPPCSLQSA